MPTYAKQTNVPVEKTRTEIERTLMRYGATGFMYGYDGSRAMIAFQMTGRRVRLNLGLPGRGEREFMYKKVNQYNYGKRRTAAEQEAAWEQACRQKWRALLLVIKAKLEAVEAGITTLDDEFLAGVMLPDGRTVGDWARPQIEQVYQTGDMPPLLPGPRSEE
jgi:hypothetical protein